MRVLFERLAGFEDRMALAGSHDRSALFPFVADFGAPRQVAQASVTIFVQLRVANFLIHAPNIFTPISFRRIFRVAYGELLHKPLHTWKRTSSVNESLPSHLGTQAAGSDRDETSAGEHRIERQRPVDRDIGSLLGDHRDEGSPHHEEMKEMSPAPRRPGSSASTDPRPSAPDFPRGS